MSSPVLRFGLLSDVQYADLDNGYNFSKTSQRYYRHALHCLDRAVKTWKDRDVDFAIHLGDIVDYHCSIQPCSPKGTTMSDKALTDVLGKFEALEKPVLHILGNHCLYNMSRGLLNDRLRISEFTSDDNVLSHSYYTFQPHENWKFIIIDGYDVSILGSPEGHLHHLQAVATLDKHNPNADKNSPAGLVGLNRRFVKFGGACSDTQLDWLKTELEASRLAGQKVIVCSHLVIHPRTAPSVCLLWNYDSVLGILHDYSDCVVATLCGHAHMDGEYKDEYGIFHRVCQAVLETPPDRDCHAVVDVFHNKIVIRGYDNFSSSEWIIL